MIPVSMFLHSGTIAKLEAAIRAFEHRFVSAVNSRMRLEAFLGLEAHMALVTLEKKCVLVGGQVSFGLEQLRAAVTLVTGLIVVLLWIVLGIVVDAHVLLSVADRLHAQRTLVHEHKRRMCLQDVLLQLIPGSVLLFAFATSEPRLARLRIDDDLRLNGRMNERYVDAEFLAVVEILLTCAAFEWHRWIRRWFVGNGNCR